MLHPSVTPSTTAGSTPAGRRSRMRWTIVGFSALGLSIAYLDRAALSVAMPFMADDFKISPAVEGVLLSAFFWTYALFQIPSGWLLDRFGPRVIYPIAVGWWSIWTTATTLATGVGSVIAFRLGLGIGEAPVQPANVKVVSQWFPRKERAFASSLFDMGQQIGTALSVPIVTALTLAAGWRMSFVVIGLAGLLWIVGWVTVYRPPEKHPRVSATELAHIRSDRGDMVATEATDATVSWRPLLRDNRAPAGLYTAPDLAELRDTTSELHQRFGFTAFKLSPYRSDLHRTRFGGLRGSSAATSARSATTPRTGSSRSTHTPASGSPGKPSSWARPWHRTSHCFWRSRACGRSTSRPGHASAASLPFRWPRESRCTPRTSSFRC
ncbi:hypothetical protein SANTM175S_05686 [Streptomyces antimycoticus]